MRPPNSIILGHGIAEADILKQVINSPQLIHNNNFQNFHLHGILFQLLGCQRPSTQRGTREPRLSWPSANGWDGPLRASSWSHLVALINLTVLLVLMAMNLFNMYILMWLCLEPLVEHVRVSVQIPTRTTPMCVYGCVWGGEQEVQIENQQNFKKLF